MNLNSYFSISRRAVLLGSVGTALSAVIPGAAGHATSPREFKITAEPARVKLVGGDNPDTAVWTYNRKVPGPEIRVRQGERVRISVANDIEEETTVHWHGVRVPNAMDGVPHLTQKPIGKGESFLYEFEVPDAGTYWYHPHQHGSVQVGRGLYGPLIVEEREPIRVDRDVVWMLGDWRLLPNAQISDDFGSFMDISHNGRVGNTVTVNGRIADSFAVRSGERIRLRLINAANARIFGLVFAKHRPIVIAYDGQPVAPHEAPEQIVLGPAMRTDLIVDMTGEPGDRASVTDVFYQGLEYRLLDFAYDAEPLRERVLEAPIALAPNTMSEPDVAAAQRHDVVLGGGMMGGMMMAMMNGKSANMREMMHNGVAWAINGVAATGHVMEPLLTLERGRPYILALRNDTAWYHPIHLHGHSFRVISRDGSPTHHREWQDTVLLKPRERAEIAFVADNPGNWMIHCHILEHQEGGMMGVIRVA